MSMESARAHLAKWGRDKDIMVSQASTATVALAAKAFGVEPERIAKTLALYRGDGAILVVAAGDAKLDNKKFKFCFECKPKMLSPEDTLNLTTHEPGGVCPFGVPEQVDVFLDSSLQRFESVFPACGTASSAIELVLSELELYSQSKGWVDVCKTYDE